MRDKEASVSAASESEPNESAELGVVAAATPIRNGHVTAESYSAALLHRARTYLDLNSFITIDESAEMSGMANEVYEKQIISVEHVTIRSSNLFDIVRTKLEALLRRLDDGIFTLLRFGQTERALRELKASPTLSIFGFRNYGELLTIASLQCRAIQYDIGNPFTASKMTRHQISAGLYAPIRVLLREDSGGVVAFEYDRPVSTFGQFGDNDVDIVARQLDQDLQSALQAQRRERLRFGRPVHQLDPA